MKIDNECCDNCKVDKECLCEHEGKCLQREFNLAINKKGGFNYSNSQALDTIKENFPDIKFNITMGTQNAYALGFRFGFYKNYTEQIYIHVWDEKKHVFDKHLGCGWREDMNKIRRNRNRNNCW